MQYKTTAMQEMTTKINLPTVKNKILLIEKDRPIIRCFRNTMFENGIGVDHCSSIKQLNERLDDLNQYDVVLIDADFKDKLEEMIKISDRPFYIMWTDDSECTPEIEECLDLGASLYLKKDQDMNRLLSLVKKVEQAYITDYLN